MISEIFDKKNGKNKKVNINFTEEEVLKFKEEIDERVKDDTLKKFIDNLNISSDFKIILRNIYESVIKIGNFVIRIGKKIVDMLMFFIEKYPLCSLGVILIAILNPIIASHSIFNILFGWILTPLTNLSIIGIAFSGDIITAISGNVTDIFKAFHGR